VQDREKHGVAVWGIGDHARRNLLPAIAGNPAIRLAGITSRNRSVCEAQAETYGCRYWPDAERMLADDAVDVVLIATPTGLHFEHTGAALEAGKHVWCDKPLSQTYGEAETLVSLASERSRSLCTVFAPPHHDQFRILSGLLACDRVGPLRSLKAVFEIPHLEPDNFRYSRSSGGGAFLDMAIYPIDISVRLMGGLPASISAEIESEDGFDVDTGGRAVLAFDGDRIAELRWGYGRPYANALTIAGSDGTITVERPFSKPPDFKGNIVIDHGPGIEEIIPVPACNQFSEMMTAFTKAIDESEIRSVFYGDALRQQKLLKQTKEAARAHLRNVESKLTVF